ncbi:type VI secretion system baseplate subunit TssG [Flexibacterium corallicola]|uniref:type VI secretion system baseplate subunit TssG n=1 Tax=Flexibacterium corallicola TaxID=3037259 RepID=UPI00286ECE1F|nr:type VI secretion system baseplate subunit TssG [Pseudovibrio sp. M1P-2-3]
MMHQPQRTLIDIPLVQAARMGLADYEQALKAGRFNPFPTGSHSVGREENRGGWEKESTFGEETSLNAPVLSSFDGVLPDYIQEAMQQGLHQDDASLRDFLAIFDSRILELQVRSQCAQILVALDDDKNGETVSYLKRLLQLISAPQESTQHLEMLLPLLSRSRSLDTLRALIAWWSGRDVRVVARFGKYFPIEKSSRSRLSARKRDEAQQLGQGAILGRFGTTAMAHIGIYLTCHNPQDLERLTSDMAHLQQLKTVSVKYLRDAVPITIYADIQRKHLMAPKLSARCQKDRLGQYSILAPYAHPEQQASLKLIERAF